MIFKKKTKKINIYFTWVELPTYGYYLLKFFNSKIEILLQTFYEAHLELFIYVPNALIN